MVSADAAGRANNAKQPFGLATGSRSETPRRPLTPVSEGDTLSPVGGELTETVPVKVDRATKAALVAIAERNERSVGAVVRVAIRSYLHKEWKR